MKSLINPSLILAILWFTASDQSANKGNIDNQERNNLSVSNDLEPKIMEVNGVNLQYVEKGEGIPVVFVHGGYGDYRTFHNQMEDFSREHRDISYSRRSYHPNNVPIDSTTDFSIVHINDLTSFIQSLNAGPVHLVGHSAGGWIALQTTIRHPELVKTLILGEPPTMELLEGDPKRDSVMNTFQSDYIPAMEAYRRNEDEEGTRLFLQVVTDDAQFFDNLSSFDQEIIMDNVAAQKASFLAQNPEDEPLSLHCANIENLTVPTLLVEGEKSPGWLIYLQDKLEACLQNKERVRLPNTTHGLEYENPEAFNKAVLQFLEKH